MSKVLTILNRDNWIQGALARDANDKPTLFVKEGIKFCLLGAVHRAYPKISGRVVAILKLDDVLHGSIGDWNDHPRRTWEEVEALIKEAGI